MRKEVIFAIFAGIAFGIVIAFGAYRANNAFNNESAKYVENQDTASENLKEITPTVGKTSLSILTPEDNDIITSNPLKISGITYPNSYVTISLANNDYITETDIDGEFTEEIELDTGINKILVSGINKDGQTSSQELLVVFSSEFEN